MKRDDMMLMYFKLDEVLWLRVIGTGEELGSEKFRREIRPFSPSPQSLYCSLSLLMFALGMEAGAWKGKVH